LKELESVRDETFALHLATRMRRTLDRIPGLPFYGVLTYQIGSGRLTELGLLENVHLRDVMGSELAKSPPAQLVEMALADQRRTLEYLRSAAPGDLRRECIADGRWRFTAEDMARRPLVAHLELHLDQLERALA
jgi:hypothetical protein